MVCVVCLSILQGSIQHLIFVDRVLTAPIVHLYIQHQQAVSPVIYDWKEISQQELIKSDYFFLSFNGFIYASHDIS